MVQLEGGLSVSRPIGTSECSCVCEPAYRHVGVGVHKLFSAPVGRQVAAAVSVVKVYGRGPWRTRSAKCFAVGWSAGRCSDSNSCALRIGQRERPNERDSAVDDVLAAVTLQGDGW